MSEFNETKSNSEIVKKNVPTFQDYLDYLEKAKAVKITEHFTLYDIFYSDTAVKNKIVNIPTTEIIARATALIKNVLEPLRQHFNAPVHVNSMYRNPILNIAVGSKTTKSQHISGQAADIYISKIPNETVFSYIRKNMVFDQLILEKTWIHVSYKTQGNRRKVV
jgi:zinc D-Ala-D-Ala carboxypeptidase